LVLEFLCVRMDTTPYELFFMEQADLLDAHSAVAVAMAEIAKDMQKSAQKMRNQRPHSAPAQTSDVLGLIKRETILDIIRSMKSVTEICWKVFQHMKEKSKLMHEEIRVRQNPTPRGGSSLQRLQNQLLEQLNDEHFSIFQEVRRRRASPRDNHGGNLLHTEHENVTQQTAPVSPKRHAASRASTAHRASTPGEGQHTSRGHTGRPPQIHRTLQQPSSSLQESRHVSRRGHEQIASPQSPGFDVNQGHVRNISVAPGDGHVSQRDNSARQASPTRPQNQAMVHQSPLPPSANSTQGESPEQERQSFRQLS